MARTETVVLLTGDYAQRLDSLYSAAQEAAQDKTPRTEVEGDPYTALREDFEALKAEAVEAATVVELTSVGRREWRTLKAKHPARTEGDKDALEGDKLAGVNTDEVEDDLVYESVSSPEFSSRASFDEWADDLSEGEWQTLVVKAWELANGARFDPKSLPASPIRSTD